MPIMHVVTLNYRFCYGGSLNHDGSVRQFGDRSFVGTTRGEKFSLQIKVM